MKDKKNVKNKNIPDLFPAYIKFLQLTGCNAVIKNDSVMKDDSIV